MIDISSQFVNREEYVCVESKYEGILYYKFSKYFVDNKHNLKDIMMQISIVSDESEQKIKEELFLLISFFILTFEYRRDTIKTMIYKNRENFYQLIEKFE